MQAPKFDFITHAKMQASYLRRETTPNSSSTGMQISDQKHDKGLLGPVMASLLLRPEAEPYLQPLAYFLNSSWTVFLASDIDAVERLSRARGNISRVWNVSKFNRSSRRKGIPAAFANSSKVTDPRLLLNFPPQLEAVVDSLFRGMMITQDDNVATQLLRRHGVPSVTHDGNVARHGEYIGGSKAASKGKQMSRTQIVFAYQQLASQYSEAEVELTKNKKLCAELSTLFALMTQLASKQRALTVTHEQSCVLLSRQCGLQLQISELKGTLEACLRHHASISANDGANWASAQSLNGLQIRKQQIHVELEQIKFKLAEASSGKYAVNSSSSENVARALAKVRKHEHRLRQLEVDLQRVHSVQRIACTRSEESIAAAQSAASEMRSTNAQLDACDAVVASLKADKSAAEAELEKMRKDMPTDTQLPEPVGSQTRLEEDFESLRCAASKISQQNTFLCTQIQTAKERLVALREHFDTADKMVLKADVERVSAELVELQVHMWWCEMLFSSNWLLSCSFCPYA